MASTLDISANLPIDGTTTMFTASVSVPMLQLQAAYKSHVDNAANSGYGPDQHPTSHIQVPAASIGIATAASDSLTTLDIFLKEITTKVAAAIGGSPASWGAVATPPTDLTTINAAITGHTIIAASAATATTATTAGSFTTPQTFTTTVSDYKGSPGTAGVINIAAGGSYEDSNGAIVAALGAQTASLPSQPTGTNTQYVGISLSPTTGAPTVTAATVNAALSTLIMPVANKPICVVLWKGVTTLPSGIVAAGDIQDIRFGGGGGAGSGGGAPTSSPYVTVGADAALSNETSIVTLLGGTASGTVNGQNLALITGGLGIKSGTNSGALADQWQLAPQADILSRISLTAANTITLAAGSNIAQNGSTSPLSHATNGRLRTNTSSISWTASGAAGPRFVITDSSGAGPGFTPVTPMPSTNTAGQYQTLLGVCWWDGSTIQPFGVSQQPATFGPMANFGSDQVAQLWYSYSASANDTIANTSGSYVRPTNFPLQTFYLPVAMKALVLSRARVTVTLTANTDFIESFVQFDVGSATQGQQSVCDMALAYAAASGTNYAHQLLTGFDEITLAAGVHTVSQNWNATSGAAGTYYVTRKVLILLSHV